MWYRKGLKAAFSISGRSRQSSRSLSSINKRAADNYVWSMSSCYEVSSFCSPATTDVDGVVKRDDNSSATFKVPLTVSDVHLRFEQLPFAYFFRQTLDEHLLKSSLQRVLRHFPVVGGRINDNFQAIECSVGDSVPLSFGCIDVSLEEWLSDESRGHAHEAGAGHPILLPLFDPLLANDKSDDHAKDSSISLPYENLLKIRVTYFQCGGTAIGVNFLHALGDTASCLRFVHCWGREMQKLSYPKGACNLRAKANVSGMMTEELADLMGITQDLQQERVQQQHYKEEASWLDSIGFYQWISSNNNDSYEDSNTQPSTWPNHEYLQLSFSAEVLSAMKDVGVAAFSRERANDTNNMNKQPFVSTNDLVTAFGWLLKRSLSGEHNWNISVVVNMRGRGGIDSFTSMDDLHASKSSDKPGTTQVEGLFGNGITNVVATHPITTKSFDIWDVVNAARAIRLALEEGISQLPDRLLHSRMGKTSQHVCTANSFPTTSWSQFRLKDISFSADTSLAAFHGHPSHPLPPGRSTYSSVITKPPRRCPAPGVKSDVKYNLLLPSEKVRDAQKKHKEICEAFLSVSGSQ